MTPEAHAKGPLHSALARLFAELTAGADPNAGWVLNRGDPGLLAVLDRLPAERASELTSGRSSVAAHVDHLRYGLELLIRWSEGEDPFSDADYSASWARTNVNQAEWETLRADLREAVGRWQKTLATPRELTEAELTGVLASVAHLAYHLGAIRQMDPALRGPPARD